jgi:hypothetical protein
VANCKETARLTEETLRIGRNPIIILSAGLAWRDGLSSRFPKQEESMAQMMRTYLIGLGVHPDHIRVPKEVWGTKAELAVLKSATEHFAHYRAVIEQTIVVASWWHVPRTKMNAESLGLDDVEFRGTEDDISIRNRIEEHTKFVAERVRIRYPWFGTLLHKLRGRD